MNPEEYRRMADLEMQIADAALDAELQNAVKRRFVHRRRMIDFWRLAFAHERSIPTVVLGCKKWDKLAKSAAYWKCLVSSASAVLHAS